MPGVAIMGSICSGHGGFHPRPSIEGTPPFTVNGTPIMTDSNAFAPHVAPNQPPHTGVAMGSSKLTVNGKKAVMIGDTVSCGSSIVTGQNLMILT